MPDARYPTPAYLLGSMIEDNVPRDLALRIAEGYAGARRSMSDEQIHQWLHAVISRLGSMQDYPSTAISVLTLSSPHLTDHYNDLAISAGWKEPNATTP